MIWSASVYLTQDTPAHTPHSLVQLLHHQQTETWLQCASYRGTSSNDTHAQKDILTVYTRTRTHIHNTCMHNQILRTNLSASMYCCIRAAISSFFLFTLACSSLLAALTTSATYARHMLPTYFQLKTTFAHYQSGYL